MPDEDVTHEARISRLEEAVQQNSRRLDRGSETMALMQLGLDKNNAATERIESSTNEIVDFFVSMKGAFKVLNWIGKAAKPMGSIVALCTALWAAWMAYKTGGKP